MALRWLFISPPSGRGDLPAEYRPPQVFTLWDDVETAYTPQGGGWVPGHHLRGDTAFVHAVPSEATRLEVAAERHRSSWPWTGRPLRAARSRPTAADRGRPRAPGRLRRGCLLRGGGLRGRLLGAGEDAGAGFAGAGAG